MNTSRRRSWFNRNRAAILESMPIKACCNCKALKNLEVHHIVPLSAGGSNYLTNMVLLCGKCHSAAHGLSSTRREHFAILQKAGIEKAKKKGVYKGRPKNNIKRGKIKSMLDEGYGVRETARIIGASTATVSAIKNGK